MIYQDPLAYLLGLEGTALLRAFAGEYDREFCEARIAEIRRLLDSPRLHGRAVTADRVETVDGYRVWSQTYDQPGNGLFPPEEAIVHEIVDPLPPGVVLDAACGTGRHCAYLAARGHQVIGVDASAEMLDRARVRVPGAQFRPGRLEAIPVPDDHVDLVVCALALSHVADLDPVMNEFARVLRPGGHLVISDVPAEYLWLASAPHVRIGDDRPGLLPGYRHRASDYLAAALPLCLQVRRCVEPLREELPIHPAEELGRWDDWPWSLLGIVPEAAAAAWNGLRTLVVWHFQLADR
jgi:SAM-dependent methyltransferase